MIDDYLDYSQFCAQYGFHEMLDLVTDGEYKIYGSGNQIHIGCTPHSVIDELSRIISKSIKNNH